MTIAARLIDHLEEGKAAMFDRLKNGESFTFPGQKEVHKKVDSGRAKSVETGKAVDVLPSDFVVRL